uniref:GSCFA domain-containing protein n=1 Tax=Heterosigma akashiwo TaxID=2829 RepID=A0A7S3XMN9_HETAK
MNPDIQVVLTVSPVRHWRDGPVANGRSKSHLLAAAHGLCDTHPERVRYFPSYELMMDDLRDYRFYAEDMFHPSDQAIEYIWGKFQQTYFSEDTLRLIEKIDKVQQAMKHRPFRPETEAHQIFLRKQLDTISILEKEHPSLNFTIERRHFDSFLTEKGSA